MRCMRPAGRPGGAPGVIDVKPVTALRGVGERQAERLRALGVETAQDLLFLLPMRYEDRTRVVATRRGGRPGQRAAIEGEVLLTEVSFRGRRQMLSRIGDGSGFLTLRFFHFTAGQQRRARAGHPRPLLRRSAPRACGPGDRAPRIPARPTRRQPSVPMSI